MPRLISLGKARVRRLIAPLAIRDVRLMWLSDLLSVLGDYAAILALAVLTFQRTGSATAVGFVSAAAFAPAFGPGPLLATLADRWPYRNVMIVCDLIRAFCFSVLLAAHVPLLALIGIVFLAHCATFPFTAARASQLPHIAGEQYGAAQSLSQATAQSGTMLGFAVGAGVLLALGPRGCLALDVGSFVLSAILISQSRARVRTEPMTAELGDERHLSARQRMRSGARTLLADELLWWPAVLVTVAGIGTAAAETLSVLTSHTVLAAAPQRSGAFAAALTATLAVTTLIAGLAAPTSGNPFRLVRVAAIMAISAHATGLILFLIMRNGSIGVVTSLLAYGALGVSCAMTVPCVTVVGKRLPADNRASTFALLEASLIGGQAVGALVGGWLVASLGASTGLALMAAPAIIVGVLCLAKLPTRRDAQLPAEKAG